MDGDSNLEKNSNIPDVNEENSNAEPKFVHPKSNLNSDTKTSDAKEIKPEPINDSSRQITDKNKKPKKKLATIILIILAILLIAGAGYAYYQKHHHKKVSVVVVTKPKLPTPKTTTNTVVSDIWVGPATGGKWSNVANWSSGIPATNSKVIFNAINGNFSANNDLNNLNINSLVFQGGSDKLLSSINITGNQIALSSGILINTGKTVTTTLQLPVQVMADQSINDVQGNLGIVAINSNINNIGIDLGNHTLSLLGGGTSGAVAINSLSGQGTLDDNQGGVVTISQNSPNFNGKVKIENQAIIVISKPQALGSASIKIVNGGALRYSMTTSTVTLANDITMEGAGIIQTTSTGAINMSGSYHPTMTLTGNITLSGNTQLGVAVGSGGGVGSGAYHITGVVANNGFSISGISSSTTISYQ